MALRAGDDAVLWLCAGAAAILIAVDSAYVILIRPASGTRETAVALSLALAALMLLGGAFARHGVIAALLIGSGAFLAFAWAALAVFSIGILLAPAALLGLVATSRTTNRLRPGAGRSIVGTAAAVALLMTAAALAFS
jgi:hypothetical protein